MSMFNDISCGSKDNEKECLLNNSFLCMQEDLEKDNGHSLVLVLRKSGTLLVKTVHKESGTQLDAVGICGKRMSNFPCCYPLSRGQLKIKGHGKLSIHYAADLETIETIFRIIVSAN